MDSFPDDFNYSSVQETRNKSILKSQLREMREKIVSSFKESIENDYFTIDFSGYLREVKTTILSELFERFPCIAIPRNHFVTLKPGFLVLQSRTFMNNPYVYSNNIFAVFLSNSEVSKLNNEDWKK